MNQVKKIKRKEKKNDTLVLTVEQEIWRRNKLNEIKCGVKVKEKQIKSEPWTQ